MSKIGLRKFPFLALLFVQLISCQEAGECCALLDIGIKIGVESASGEDLLNPANPNAFDIHSIKIYHMVDGSFETVRGPNLGNPRGFDLSSTMDSSYYIRIDGDLNSQESIVTSLIAWNNLDTDTLKYEVNRGNDGSIKTISKVWYNDVEMWTSSSYTERYFMIKK